MDHEYIKGCTLFCGISDDDIGKLLECINYRRCSYRKGAVMIPESLPADSIGERGYPRLAHGDSGTRQKRAFRRERRIRQTGKPHADIYRLGGFRHTFCGARKHTPHLLAFLPVSPSALGKPDTYADRKEPYAHGKAGNNIKKDTARKDTRLSVIGLRKVGEGLF